MRDWLALSGLGVGLFVAALFGTLALQGRLDHAGTRGIPVVSWLFEDPAADLQVLPGPVQDPAATAGSAGPGEVGDPEAESAEPDATGDAVPGDGLFEFPRLDSGLTAEDLERILRAARAAEEAARVERARIDAAEADLLARQRDLEDRESRIAAQMLRVDQERDRLERRIADFERKVLLVEQDELRGLREYARSLSSFDPQRAAEIVLQEWDTEDGRKRIVKVLAVMDPADADSILARIDRERIREVLLERLKIVLEPRDR